MRMGRLRGARRWVLPLAALALAALFRNALRQVAGIALPAALLAFLLAPLCRLLERRFSPGASALLSLVLTSAALLALLWAALPPLLRQISAVGDTLSAFGLRARGIYEGAQARAAQYGLRLPDADAVFHAQRLLSGTVAAAESLAAGAYRFSLAVPLCGFFLADRRRLLLRLELCVPARWRGAWLRLASALRQEMYLYLRGQAMVSFSVGVLSAAALLAAGIPSAPLLGMVVGVMDLIPYFGPVLGAIPAVITALGMGPVPALLAAGAIALVQQIDSMFISPRIMGGLTGFSPAAVLLIVLAGSALGGIAGMLLALPAAMALRTAIRFLVCRLPEPSSAGTREKNTQNVSKNPKNI